MADESSDVKLDIPYFMHEPVDNMINMGALEVFGPDRIIDENAGCPVCAFANIVPHVGDLMARKYGSLN
jgi:hypothetical protein